MKVAARRSTSPPATSGEERLGDDVIPTGSEAPEAGGITNPGYLSDVGDEYKDNANERGTPVPDIVESLPVDAIMDRKSRDAEFRYKILKSIFMVLGPCSMVCKL